MGKADVLKRFRPKSFARVNDFDVNDVIVKKDYDFKSLLSLKVVGIFEKRNMWIRVLLVGFFMYIVGMFLALDSSNSVKWQAGVGICIIGLIFQVLGSIIYLVYVIKSAKEAELKFNELVQTNVLSSDYNKYSKFIEELYADKKHKHDPVLKSFAFALLIMKLNDKIYV